MNNITLGKVLKAMYKLSGKTLSQLSDEADLTVDTINNLFYARVQKPGLIGVNALVNAMGFSIQQLMSFLETHPDLSDESDVTEIFTTCMAAAGENTNTSVSPAKETVKTAKESFSAEIELLNADHEKQLDRFRATHQRYVEHLKEQHNRHIEQMQTHEKQMELQFDKSIGALKDAYSQEIRRMECENAHQRKSGKLLIIIVGIESSLILLMLILDMLNHNIGWLR